MAQLIREKILAHNVDFLSYLALVKLFGTIIYQLVGFTVVIQTENSERKTWCTTTTTQTKRKQQTGKL